MLVQQSSEFKKWLLNLRDRQGRAKIVSRLERLEEGNPGNTKSVGSGVRELKIDFGPGYRVYFIQRGSVLILLLCGGDKSSQEKDIRKAKAMAEEEFEEE